MIKVLPSTNPCQEGQLVDYAKSLDNLGVEYIHCDVMDGKFVENKCLDISYVKDIYCNTNVLLDVHLMVEDIDMYVEQYLSIKPSIITIHLEALKSFKQFIKLSNKLKEKDIMVGLSIKPSTDISIIKNYMDYVDLILVMSVEPGKSGQSFIENSIDRIKKLKEMIAERRVIIEVDGGINEKTYKDVVDAGATFLVMGSAFYNANDKYKLLTTIDSHYKR